MADVRDAGQFGVTAGEPSVDFAAIMQRMRRLRAKISPHDSATRFRDELGVDVFLGDARFSVPETVEVDGQTLRFSKAVIATGKASALTVPWCTYTDPEVAHVGLYPDDAKEKGFDVQTFRIPLK